MTQFRQLEHHEVQNFTTSKEIILFIEPISSPENIGGIFRIAEAMGVQKIYWKNVLLDLSNKKITKISRNTNQKILYQNVTDYSILNELQKQGFQISALELTTHAQNIHHSTFPNKLVLIIGNEAHGVSKEALALCDSTYFIPMYGENSSMNLVVSLGIALNSIV
ncbi:hypothetical protein UJ101_01144 [Flavobacteriaceae bacterium UJ101]|nr:hypothetical protein UJ101_01144 [Flavobacteriaceae bacterium UJ101]